VTNAGKTVLVTGAGGSIGSEICRQVALQKPARIVLFDNSELALYNIDRELSPTAPVAPILGDVSNAEDVQEVFHYWDIDTVYHAAAYKHVTMVQKNPRIAARVNIVGTRRVALTASRHNVKTLVLVSSDKAVKPICTMGVTKARAEDIIRMLGYTVVRFGNVLGSSGSVVPLFEEQIARGGPVTVTHPDATRYFMSVEKAARFVIDAGVLGQGTYVLDMGAPIKIDDLARDLIGDKGIEIEYIGLRPGEKMHEELFAGLAMKTPQPHIFEDVL
jgi:FlaA1/EpsC-like NDP-sugar epimerase